MEANIQARERALSWPCSCCFADAVAFVTGRRETLLRARLGSTCGGLDGNGNG